MADQAVIAKIFAPDTYPIKLVDNGDGTYGVSTGPSGGGGGIQYTEGATDATITGTVAMWEDAGDTLVATSAAKPIPVNVVAGAAAGTEYTEGATDATITGPAIMWEDTADTLRAVSAAKPLPVVVISGAGGGGVVTTGTLTAAAQTVTADIDDFGSVGVSITGTFSLTWVLEASTDGTNFTAVPCEVWNVAGSGTVSSGTTVRHLRLKSAGGFRQFRVRCSAYTSGTADVTIVGSPGASYPWIYLDSTTTTYAATDPGLPIAIRNQSFNTVAASDFNWSPLAVDSRGNPILSGVTSLTAANSLAKAADGASTATDPGIVGLSIRDDSLAAITPAENDYAPTRVNSRGALWIAPDTAATFGVSGTVAVSSVGGTVIVAPTTEKTEDVAHSTGAAGDFILGVRNDGATVLTTTDGDYSPIATDSAGRVGIADLGGTITVDGTVAVTGVSTLAEQQTQTTALQLLDDVIIADNAAFTDGTTKVSMSGFIFDEVAGTALTENDAAAARIDSKRAQIGIIEDGATRGRWATVTASNAVKVDGSAVTQPVSGTVSVTGVSTLAEQQTQTTALQLIDDPVFVDNAAFTDNSSKVNVVGYYFDDTAGTALTENDVAAARIDSKRAQMFVQEDATTRGQKATVTSRGSTLIEGPTAADSAIAAPPVTVGGRTADAVPTAMTADGEVVNAWLGRRGEQVVTVEPKAFGGLSKFRSIDVDETEEDIKTSAGTLYGWYMYNDGASEVYVKFYDLAAASVTVGTTTPYLTVPIPAGSATNVEFTNGIAFTTAICVAATTGVADADTTAPAANQVVGNFFYK